MLLDEFGNLQYAANAKHFCIPSSILHSSSLTLHSLDSDGSLHEITKSGEGSEYVVMPKAGVLSDYLSAQAIKATISGSINGKDIKYLRKLIGENNLASIDLSEAKIVTASYPYYQSYSTTLNVMGAYAFDGFKKLVSMRLPQKINKIEDRAFRFSGLRMIEIPDAVASIGLEAFGGCDMLTTVIIGKKVSSISQGVFYNSPVKEVYVKALTPPTLSDYVFNSKPTIHVYASALAKYQSSSWAKFGTIVGDLTDEIIDGIEEIKNEKLKIKNEIDGQNDGAVFDLMGRRVTTLQPGSIYIWGGKKLIVK